MSAGSMKSKRCDVGTALKAVISALVTEVAAAKF
jgi:hypothetical protein